jgi:hypothetical protein
MERVNKQFYYDIQEHLRIRLLIIIAYQAICQSLELHIVWNNKANILF